VNPGSRSGQLLILGICLGTGGGHPVPAALCTTRRHGFNSSRSANREEGKGVGGLGGGTWGSRWSRPPDPAAADLPALRATPGRAGALLRYQSSFTSWSQESRSRATAAGGFIAMRPTLRAGTAFYPCRSLQMIDHQLLHTSPDASKPGPGEPTHLTHGPLTGSPTCLRSPPPALSARDPLPRPQDQDLVPIPSGAP
jgi:hypothetical protein